MKARLTVRNDTAGSGEFGASRDGGNRTHRGIDYLAAPTTIILSPCYGTVTKLGYPYGDDLSYRYVEITHPDNSRHRVFYVDPSVSLGDWVGRESPIGEAQDVTTRYPDRGMQPHIHYEVIDVEGIYKNPDRLRADTRPTQS